MRRRKAGEPYAEKVRATRGSAGNGRNFGISVLLGHQMDVSNNKVKTHIALSFFVPIEATIFIVVALQLLGDAG